MQKNILQEAINLKKEKKEFSIITDLSNAKNYIYHPDTKLHEDLENFSKVIDLAIKKKTNGIIENTQLFVENYHRPIQVVVVGAVHIAQYLCDFAKHLNLET